MSDARDPREARRRMEQILEELDGFDGQNCQTYSRYPGREPESGSGSIPPFAFGTGFIILCLGKAVEMVGKGVHNAGKAALPIGKAASHFVNDTVLDKLWKVARSLFGRVVLTGKSGAGARRLEVQLGRDRARETTSTTKPMNHLGTRSIDPAELLESAAEIAEIMKQFKAAGGDLAVAHYDPQRRRYRRYVHADERPAEPPEETTGSETDVLSAILENDRLPVIPGAVDEIRRRAFSMNTSWDEIMPLIKVEPVLTGKILDFINAPIRRRVHPVSNVQQACVLIGPRRVAGIALGLALRPQVAIDSVTFDPDRFWAASAARAAAAWRIAKELPDTDPQDAYTTGLLCRIGELALAVARPRLYDEVRIELGGGGRRRQLELERIVVGTTHSEIGAAIAERWNLPAWFSNVLGHVDDENLDDMSPATRTKIRTVAAAGEIASVFLGSKGDALRRSIVSLQAGLDALELPRPLTGRLFDESVEEWQATCGVYDASCTPVDPWDKILEDSGLQSA